MKQKIRTLLTKVRHKLGKTEKEAAIRTIAVCAAQVPFFSGGAEACVQGLVENLRIRGFEVDLINLPYKWYPREQLLKSIEVWKMLDLSESNGKKIDLVIATKFPSYFVRHPRKVLWLIHQYRQIYDLLHTPYSGFDPSSRRDMARRDELVAMDTEALKSYPRIYTIAYNTADRLKTYNHIEGIPLYHPPPLAGKYRTDSYQDFVLSVGRLDKLKRLDLLIEGLRHTRSSITCRIAGTGPERDRLQGRVKEAGLSDRVEFLGYVSNEDLLRLYATCGAVFFAPQDEDYGYITLEAFLSRKPVITAFDSGGPLEFVEDGVNGSVLQVLDGRTAGRAIENLLSDKALGARWGNAGFDRVKDMNWDRVVDALVHGEEP